MTSGKGGAVPVRRVAVPRRPVLLPVLLVPLLLLAGLSPARAADPGEGEKIEFLLRSVEGLKGAVFLRNGEEHDGRAAAAHLRRKLEKAGGRVRTAEDFIVLCASRSHLSGKPYAIRFADGRTVEAERYLRERLKEFRPARR